MNIIRDDLIENHREYCFLSSDINVVPRVVVNDNQRPRVRIAAGESLRRIQGLAIVDHIMHQPSKDNKWYYSSTNHVVREI